MNKHPIPTVLAVGFLVLGSFATAVAQQHHGSSASNDEAVIKSAMSVPLE